MNVIAAAATTAKTSGTLGRSSGSSRLYRGAPRAAPLSPSLLRRVILEAGTAADASLRLLVRYLLLWDAAAFLSA